jgi:hypothetical protein
MGYLKRKLDRARIRNSVREAEAAADPFSNRAWLAIPQSPPAERRFLRFATKRHHDVSGRREGIFSAAYRLCREGSLAEDEAADLHDLLDWFGSNLPTPPHDFDDHRAIFLFRSEAGECTQRIWDLVGLLSFHGVRCEMQEFTDPGLIVWDDEYQIAVVPSSRSTDL